MIRLLQWGIGGPALTIMAVAGICTCPMGCGLTASPQPPSLYLPKPVQDLTAARTGTRVALRWDTPRETTDRLKIHAPVHIRICRQLKVEECRTVATISAAQGKPAEYEDALPPELRAGALQPITYEVFALNKHGRSAGPSNAASTLAGEVPPTVQDFSATMEENGVMLRWKAALNLPADTSVELRRTLLKPAGTHASIRSSGGLPPVSELVEQILRVPADAALPGVALDTGVVFDRRYRYVATRVAGRKVGTEFIHVASAPSAPVVIVTRDTFPPAAPSGLIAVPVPASLNGGAPEVDLSWSANTDPDFSHYLAYRRDLTTGQVAPDEIEANDSTAMVAPAFRDFNVQPGHTYAYSVVAVDNAGNRSPRSAEAVAKVPLS